MSLTGRLYKAGFIVLWCASAAFFLMFLYYKFLNMSNGDVDVFWPITVIAGAGFNGLAIFSFLKGAQTGHWVRAVFIVVVAVMSLLCFYRQIDIASDYWVIPAMRATEFFALALSFSFSKKFREKYKKNGRVDYFEIYFPNKNAKSQSQNFERRSP